MTTSLFLLAVLISVLGRVLGEDAKTLVPRFSRFLLRRAARRINDTYSGGFHEDWMAHLDETPELTLKLWHAFSINAWGAGRVGREIGFSHNALGRYDAIKRAFDLFAALVLFPTALLFALIAALAAIPSGCRPLVAREVVGPNGRRFRVWKIGAIRYPRTVEEAKVISDIADRSYVTNSDCFLVPRGVRLIRRMRLDDFPMIWSVLKGDLSLVGPRMQNKHLNSLTGPAEYSRPKPGISGLAQLRTVACLEPTEVAKLDLQYCQRRSLAIDLKIIWLTMVSGFLRR